MTQVQKKLHQDSKELWKKVYFQSQAVYRTCVILMLQLKWVHYLGILNCIYQDMSSHSVGMNKSCSQGSFQAC